jgi:thiamine pyrophosphokinase
MSSHHIIKDNQEPALIIANGEACNNDILGQLLEWSPTILVLDGAIDRVLALGIKINYLLGDFDSGQNHNQILDIQSDIEIIHTPNQDKTDLEKAIEFLLEKGYNAANIIWATGRRADHTISNMTNLVRYRTQIKLVMIDNHSKIFPLANTFEKWYPKGSTISLIPIGIATGIKTKGLLYNLNNESLTLGYRSGNSNEAANDGIVKISYQQGDMLLMECWD